MPELQSLSKDRKNLGINLAEVVQQLLLEKHRDLYYFLPFCFTRMFSLVLSKFKKGHTRIAQSQNAIISPQTK